MASFDHEPVIRITAMPADANAYGDIFGGWLVGLMDMGAGVVAAHTAKGRAVTVAMDAVQFLAPVKVGDEVSVYGRLEKIGRTSLTVHVTAWRREHHVDERTKVTEAMFTFVAIDSEGKPRALDTGSARTP